MKQLNTSRPQTIIGTMYYVAPEAVHGCPHTTATDIWGLGVTCFQLFTCLQYPFDYDIPGDMPQDQVQIHILKTNHEADWQPRWPDGMNPAVRDFLGRMLERDPLTRATAEEL